MDKDLHVIISRFHDALEAFGIEVSTLIMYGSNANGNAREHSDIDIAVISDSFEGMNTLQRQTAIGMAAARAGLIDPIEALGYTVEEYESFGPGTFVGEEVKAKGIAVA
ncbi:MAG: nucleotidyltransferase domain-containing protein [Candidatus Coatesbacteria bacterium]|nr:nucleotidyltransferase domain-containing protein [Candidatus Coatesbacteria bacterium]